MHAHVTPEQECTPNIFPAIVIYACATQRDLITLKVICTYIDLHKKSYRASYVFCKVADPSFDFGQPHLRNNTAATSAVHGGIMLQNFAVVRSLHAIKLALPSTWKYTLVET